MTKLRRVVADTICLLLAVALTLGIVWWFGIPWRWAALITIAAIALAVGGVELYEWIELRYERRPGSLWRSPEAIMFALLLVLIAGVLALARWM